MLPSSYVLEYVAPPNSRNSARRTSQRALITAHAIEKLRTLYNMVLRMTDVLDPLIQNLFLIPCGPGGVLVRQKLKTPRG